MIRATVSSWACFCWLYRASPSLATKNVINLISVLTIWWCPCVESSLVLLEEGVCYNQCVLLKNSVRLCLASFCTPRPNLPDPPDVSWLPTFAFQSPIMKRTSFLGVSSGRSCSLHAAAAAAAKSLQSCPTLCDPRDGSPLGSPIPGILQARILEWVAISFSSRSS